MDFYKLHGIGNDFILFDDRDGYFEGIEAETAIKLCHRRFSIGADGIIFIRNSKTWDIQMVIYNSDGSYASMCGNGIRCFSKFIYEKNIVRKKEIKIETGDGVKTAYLNIENGKVSSVKINMGKVIPDNDLIGQNIEVNGRTYVINHYHMGVPHTVIYGKLSDFDVNEGKYIQKLNIFKEGTNVNFVEASGKDEFSIRTYERGAGLTMACGTGTCASFYYLSSKGIIGTKAKAHLLGGDLTVEMKDGDIFMEGPAEISFKGEVRL